MKSQDNEHLRLKELLVNFETVLCCPLKRQDFMHAYDLIHDDFFEIGQSGQRFQKKDVIDYLESQKVRQFELLNPTLTKLSDDILLLNYRYQSQNGASLRTSLWRKSENSLVPLQMIFHQGTACDKV